MIPVYLIYDNKGNRYGASRSIIKAEEIKTKIENEMRKKKWTNRCQNKNYIHSVKEK